jgi:hypothetical protein
MQQGERRQIARGKMQPGVIRMAERPGFQDEPDIGERGQNRPVSGFYGLAYLDPALFKVLRVNQCFELFRVVGGADMERAIAGPLRRIKDEPLDRMGGRSVDLAAFRLEGAETEA